MYSIERNGQYKRRGGMDRIGEDRIVQHYSRGGESRTGQ
jgi:hypothetical protein